MVVHTYLCMIAIIRMNHKRNRYRRPLTSCQGALLNEHSRNGPLDRITPICGGAVREPDDIHRFKMLRNAFVPAPFLARRRARL